MFQTILVVSPIGKAVADRHNHADRYNPNVVGKYPGHASILATLKLIKSYTLIS